MVRWDVFRHGQIDNLKFARGGQRIYDYACRQKRLVDLVGNSGTLWLVTSRRKAEQPRRYSLAYKLVGCSPVDPEASPSELFGRYAVRGNMRTSEHFPHNDFTDTLRRFEFRSGKSMEHTSNMGLRVLSIPELSEHDIDLVGRFEEKLKNSRNVFVSYSREDITRAEQLEQELFARNMLVARDAGILGAGDKFADVLRKEAKNADCFVVLITPHSAVSEWVHKEVDWAVGEYEAQGFVKKIVPIVSADGGWDAFPKLHEFHKKEWPRRPDNQFFESLAAEIAR